MQLFDALHANSIVNTYDVMVSKGENASIPIKVQCINYLFGSLEEFMEILADETVRKRVIEEEEVEGESL